MVLPFIKSTIDCVLGSGASVQTAFNCDMIYYLTPSKEVWPKVVSWWGDGNEWGQRALCWPTWVGPQTKPYYYSCCHLMKLCSVQIQTITLIKEALFANVLVYFCPTVTIIDLPLESNDYFFWWDQNIQKWNRMHIDGGPNKCSMLCGYNDSVWEF